MAKKLIDLPLGTLIKDNETKIFDEPIVWRIVDKNHEGYPDESVTLISDKELVYFTFDNSEPNNPLTSGKGWSKYATSNIRQWLNSDASEGEWYKSQHEYDVQPRAKDFNKAGFLNGFSSFFKKSLLETEIPTYIRESQSIENTTDKVFLPSLSEMGLTSGSGSIEGTQFEYFTDNNTRIAYGTYKMLRDQGYNEERANELVSNPFGYLLRTSRNNSETSVFHISNAGNTDGTHPPESESPTRPCCNIKSTLTVKDTPDEDGVYILIPRKVLYIFKPDTTEYLATVDDEMLLSQDGLQLVGAPEIDRYAYFAGVMKHKIYYVDGTSRIEDCLATNCPCGRPDTTI